MRYEDWDVILFPDVPSRVPIQEFKTQCFVTKEHLPIPGTAPFPPGATASVHPSLLHLPTATAPLTGSSLLSPMQTPCLTSFVPARDSGSPFRVSVHNWSTKPTPSKAMEYLMGPNDEVVFEVKVFIDGQCIAASLIQDSRWPHVIDYSSFIDKYGNQDVLRFPPFHDELLHQSFWDASEAYGRIRVVITEGFSRPNRSPPYERIKDLVIFSFQHAPLPILENAGIAWPNPGMWQVTPRPAFKYDMPGFSYMVSRDNEPDGHVHTPSRRLQPEREKERVPVFNPAWPYHVSYPTSANAHLTNDRTGRWTQEPQPHDSPQRPGHMMVPEQNTESGRAPPDPFTDQMQDNNAPSYLPHRRGNGTSDDVSMKDFRSAFDNGSGHHYGPNGQRNSSSMTGSSMRSRAYVPLAPVPQMPISIQASGPPELRKCSEESGSIVSLGDGAPEDDQGYMDLIAGLSPKKTLSRDAWAPAISVQEAPQSSPEKAGSRQASATSTVKRKKTKGAASSAPSISSTPSGRSGALQELTEPKQNSRATSSNASRRSSATGCVSDNPSAGEKESLELPTKLLGPGGYIRGKKEGISARGKSGSSSKKASKTAKNASSFDFSESDEDSVKIITSPTATAGKTSPSCALNIKRKRSTGDGSGCVAGGDILNAQSPLKQMPSLSLIEGDQVEETGGEERRQARHDSLGESPSKKLFRLFEEADNSIQQ